ncbi:hypothetical protein QTP88_005213 [Uroleucon formosanum]
MVEVRTGPRQEDALSPILFNLVLEKVIREINIGRDEGVRMDRTCFSLLAYADDIVLLGEEKQNVVDLCDRLIELAKKVGLHLNVEKTQYMKVSRELDNFPGTETITVGQYEFKKSGRFQKAEPLVKEISMEEVKAAIRSLKNCKAPGSDSIPSELIKYGGDDIYNFIYRICLRVWQEEKIPENWNEAIIIPLHKKGDKTECNNYRGISLLNSVYKIFSKVLLNRLIPYAEECLGEYQSGFRKGRSTIEQLSVIAQIIEKKYEFRQNMWQMFVDFRKAYDSIHRNSLYNIMEEFGFPDKLINLTKLAMEGVKYQVRVDNFMSEAFSVETGLKQGDALSPLLFNIALEKAIRVLQNESRGLNVDEHQIKVLGFADDLNILGDSLDDTYLGVLLSTKNDWSREIGSRITKAERAFFALLKFFKSKLFSKRTKTRLYTSIIRPILTYGCEVWTTTIVTQRRLGTFENKIWRRICGPIRDPRTGQWRRKFNQELKKELNIVTVNGFIKSQRIKWIGHVMRRNTDALIKVALNWKSEGRRPRGRPRKRWMDVVEKDLEDLGAHNWREIVQDRDKLINPAKRFIISNVCPSIPNLAIVDTLRNIGIISISQINHFKAGINEEGYEHISSFRRQMFLNHEDIPKLPSSLLININENQFIIFFTNDKITYFLCKSVGHTTSNCNKNIENKHVNYVPLILSETDTPEDAAVELIEDTLPPTIPNVELQLDQTTMDWFKEIEPPSPTQISFVETLNLPPTETHKRLLSNSSSIKPPTPLNNLTAPTTTPDKGKITKKIKIRSRSNSADRQEKNSEENLKPVYVLKMGDNNFEQRCAIRFCFKLGHNATETFQKLQQAYGEDVLSRARVFRWFKAFSEGRELIEDEPRSGRPSTSKNDENIAKVRDLVRSDRRMTVRMIGEQLGLSHTTVHQILTVDLEMRKICAKMVPKILSQDQKDNRRDRCLDFLEQIANDHSFLERVITGDESWIFEYDPETKRQSQEWHTSASPRQKKGRMSKSKIKTMLICFFDSQGIVHKEFVPQGQTVNQHFYKEVLERLRKRVIRVRPNIKNTWVLHHKNAPCHTAISVNQFLATKNIPVAPQPPY